MKASLRSQHSKWKVGAAIFKKGRMVASGFNHQHKSHPIMNEVDGDKMIHAELDAIIKVRHLDLSQCVMVVFRTKKDGSLGMSRPCPACQQILKSFGIKKVMYTTAQSWAMENL